MPETNFTPTELYDVWPVLSRDERVEGFELLRRDDAEAFFLQLSARDRAQLILALPPGERRLWMRLLAPDDAADVIQEAPADQREVLLSLLDDITHREVKGLLAYAEDEAGSELARPLMERDQRLADRDERAGIRARSSLLAQRHDRKEA